MGPASIRDISNTFIPARGPLLEAFERFFLFNAILRLGLYVEYNLMINVAQNFYKFKEMKEALEFSHSRIL